MTEPRRRRGPRSPSDAPELDETALVTALRSRAHRWLAPPPPPAPEPVLPVAPEAPAPLAEPAAPPPAEPPPPEKRRRAPKRDGALAASSFRRRAWTWLRPTPAAAPPKRKRAPRPEPALPDAVRRLRRNAWWWLRPTPVAAPTPVPPEPADQPRRRRSRRDAVPDAVAELRRRAWAWFAPKATGESAAGTHAPVRAAAISEAGIPGGDVVRAHLKGVLEALIFASEHPLPARELARIAQADLKLVKTLLAELSAEYHPRGVRLDEVAGGFVFRTSPVFAPFVREQVAKKPVRMSRAQIETLAIVAYRQPITRPEIDDVRGVDSGAVLKSLLERSLVRILGKKDEPGRPMLYGTTGSFLEFFGLKALGDLPTLREFTELTDESKRAYERALGEEPADTGLMGADGQLVPPPAPIDPTLLEEDPTLPPDPVPLSDPAPVPDPAPNPDPEAPPDSEPRASASGPEPRASASGPEQEAAGGDEDKDEDEDDEDEDEDDEEDEDEDDEEDEDEDDEEDEDEDDEDEDEDEDADDA